MLAVHARVRGADRLVSHDVRKVLATSPETYGVAPEDGLYG